MAVAIQPLIHVPYDVIIDFVYRHFTVPGAGNELGSRPNRSNTLHSTHTKQTYCYLLNDT